MGLLGHPRTCGLRDDPGNYYWDRRSGIERFQNQAIAVAGHQLVELIRNTPFLVQIYFIFFALPFVGIKLSPTPTAVIALGVNGGAYAIEIIRGGVQSISKGQIEAGLVRAVAKIAY
jgi:ABC-type amino acid transport system permease subunit